MNTDRNEQELPQEDHLAVNEHTFSRNEEMLIVLQAERIEALKAERLESKRLSEARQRLKILARKIFLALTGIDFHTKRRYYLETRGFLYSIEDVEPVYDNDLSAWHAIAHCLRLHKKTRQRIKSKGDGGPGYWERIHLGWKDDIKVSYTDESTSVAEIEKQEQESCSDCGAHMETRPYGNICDNCLKKQEDEQ